MFTFFSLFMKSLFAINHLRILESRISPHPHFIDPLFAKSSVPYMPLLFLLLVHFLFYPALLVHTHTQLHIHTHLCTHTHTHKVTHTHTVTYTYTFSHTLPSQHSHLRNIFTVSPAKPSGTFKTYPWTTQHRTDRGLNSLTEFKLETVKSR